MVDKRDPGPPPASVFTEPPSAMPPVEFKPMVPTWQDMQYNEWLRIQEKDFARRLQGACAVPSEYFVDADYGRPSLYGWPWGLDVEMLRLHYAQRRADEAARHRIRRWRQEHPGRDFKAIYARGLNALVLVGIEDAGPAEPEDNVQMGE
jgi:hypothetical protein